MIGKKVQYPVHPLNHHDDGTFSPIGEEEWRDAEVLDVFEHPPHHGEEHRWVPEGVENHPLAAGTVDTVLKLQPADGSPPFDINSKLVRHA